ncbi:hypothetical protein [Fuerstiella marisgermanici]|uniref:Uncharacterized protein n=1 Tax=Fuerstiella marisgermanici TaxID=1891926 RepID=A0A1P8WCN5_9PLAN|nr:hypothetical protein [Fuerstiella marisgermanici]APZ91813.1 hypothetical protein Fuma_01407 [Fuerstiella marisgermanici]
MVAATPERLTAVTRLAAIQLLASGWGTLGGKLCTTAKILKHPTQAATFSCVTFGAGFLLLINGLLLELSYPRQFGLFHAFGTKR